jgi:ParB family chromosome partitioning protein
MATTNVAEKKDVVQQKNVVENKEVVEKKEEKVEKRKALGRGLASLLPGPRAVGSGEVRVPSRERNDLPQGLKPQASAALGGTAEAVPFPDVVVRESSGAGVAVAPAPVSSAPVPTTPSANAPAPNAVDPNGAVSPATSPKEQVPNAAIAPSPTVPGHDEEADGEGDVISIQAAANSVVPIDVTLIDRNPYQTRYIFDEELLEELADSIRTNGVVQPVVVRPGETAGRYVLVLGERRLRASKLAGKATIPALVRRLSRQQAAEMTVLENIQRQDLNAVEQAEAFRVLSKEFNLTQAQIAQRIGVSRETVSNYMRLLRLPEEVMQYVLNEQITFSEAREILSLDNDEHIPLLAKEAVEKEWKLDQIERRVRELNGFVALQEAEGWEAKEASRRSARWMDPNVRAAQTDMERTLGMRVRIRDRNGKGKITIEYATVDDYQRVTELLRSKKK